MVTAIMLADPLLLLPLV